MTFPISTNSSTFAAEFKKPLNVQFKMENRKCNYPPRAVLEDGTEIRLVPLNLTGGKPLYVSKDGQGYSYVREKFRAIKDTSGNERKRRDKDAVRKFRMYNSLRVQRAVLEAWGYPRPKGYECDHINGNPSDNRLENLEWVTHEENMRRRWVSYARQGKSYRGKRLTELGKDALRKRKTYALKHGILLQLELQFPEN